MASRTINELDFHWLQMHLWKSSQSQLIRGSSAKLLAGVFSFFSLPLPLTYPSSMYLWVALKKDTCSAGYLNLNGWFSPSRKCYYGLFMIIRCFYGLQGVLRFLARSDYHINTSLCADKKFFFYFFRQKRQQMRQTGQRLIEMDCILWRRVWI